MGLTAAEKSAQLESAGEQWPTCHGEPMMWNRDSRRTRGGYFRCRVEYLERQNSRREERRRAELCIFCGRQAVTETRCRECADYYADLMATPKQKFQHQFASIRWRRKQQDSFRPTGSGRAAFAAWLENLTGR